MPNLFSKKMTSFSLVKIFIFSLTLLALTNQIMAKDIPMNLVEFVNLVKQKHPELRSKKLTSKLDYTKYQEEPIVKGFGGNAFANYNQNLTSVSNSTERTTFDYGWEYKFIRGGTTFKWNNEHAKTKTTQIGNEITSWNTKVNFKVTQPLLKGGFFNNLNQRLIDTKKTAYQISENSYNIELASYIKNALLLYHRYQSAKKSLNLSKKILKDSKKLLYFNQKRVVIGVVTKSEILKTKAELLKSQSELDKSQADIKTLNQNLKYFIGKGNDTSGTLKFADKIKIKKVTINQKKAIDTALKERPEFKLYNYRKEANQNAVAIARESTFFPTLNAFLQYSLIGKDDTLSGSFSDLGGTLGTLDGSDLSFGLNFSIKTDISAYALATKTVDLTANKINLEEEEFTIKLKNEVREKIRILKNAYKKESRMKQILNLENQRYEIATKDYFSGKVDLSQYIQTKTDIRKATINHLTSQVDYWDALLSLKLSQGVLLKQYGVEVFKLDIE